jgi:outer membrane receptor protein involved in Fe transport
MDGAFLNSGFVIRGMSTEGFVPAGAPMGSVYVDGVLQTRYSARFGARNLLDVEQVEVYRGPQSTLSGRAATAGAVYIKTKDPVFEPQAEVSGTLGNNDLVGMAFTASLPVIDDQLAVRLSGSFENAETTVSYPGYEQFANHDSFKKEISRNLRAKLLLQPAGMPDTKVLLNYSYSNDRPNERLIGEGPDFGLDDNRGDWYAFPTYAEFRQIKVHNAGLEVTHQFSEALKLTSQSGFHYGNTIRKSVDQGTPGLVNGIDGDVDDTLVSQEIRLNYDNGQRWSWVAGIFASYQSYDSTFDAALDPYLELAETFERKTTNLAAFGEATYEFLPSWKVTLGGRLDYLREKTLQNNADTYPYGGVPFEYENRADFDEVNFVPKIALSKEIGDTHTVGVVYSQGFRTGGFYVNYNTGEAAYYDPETAKNYELFFKGRFFGGRLTLNSNLFYTTYDDQQIEIRPDPNNQSYRETANAASSRAWGLEFEPAFQVTERLSMFASVGYLDTEFKEFNHASYGDLSGEPFPEAPEWTVGFGGRYELESGFYIGGDAKYLADYIADFGISPVDPINSRIVVNGQIGYRAERWELNIFAQNLFNKRYLTFIDRDAVPVYAQVGPQRSLGMNVRVKF